MLNCPFGLNDLKISKYGKPYIEGDINFSLSYAHEIIVCIISDKHRVGIGLEKNDKFENFREYELMFTQADWEHLSKNLTNTKLFFKYWTKKESIMKADGRGISDAFAELELEGKKVYTVDNEDWYEYELDLFEGYTCHYAINSENFYVEVKQLAVHTVLLTCPAG